MISEPKAKRQRLYDVLPRSAPFTMFIDPCGRCNFSCKFCPCNNSEYNVKKRHSVMSFDIFKKIVDDLDELEDKVRIINLYNFGEPLLNPYIIQMIELLKERDAKREVRIVTNGSLLNPQLNQQIVNSGVDIMRISLEGLNESDYYKICGVKINLDKFYSNVADLYARSRGTKTKVSIKIISSMLKTTNDVTDFTNKFSPISDYQFVTKEEVVWPGFEKSDNKKLSFDAVSLNWDTLAEAQSHICSAPLIYLNVFANGEVGFCNSDWRMENIVGDVRNQSIGEIYNSEMIREFRRKHLLGMRKSIPLCSECLGRSPDNIDEDAIDILRKIER